MTETLSHMNGALAVHDVGKRYGEAGLHPLSHYFRAGATTVLIGPSGCGKSTLLRILIGLIRPDTGSVIVQGEEMAPANVEILRRQIGYVIQEGGLFPHLTAWRNVALMARYLGWEAERISARIRLLAELVHIPPQLLEQYPTQLSGGQRQRVGLMRALMLDPPILLLDEPMGALDPLVRFDLQTQLKDIFQRLKKTVVLVTHDLHEAAWLGDEVMLMRAGRIVQRGQLLDLMQTPADPFVTEFIRAQRTWMPDRATGEVS